MLKRSEDRNTKLRVGSLGEVELKYISHGDTREFDNVLDQELSDKDFVLQILFHQLIKPEMSLEKFREISDEDLKKILKAFAEKEAYTFGDLAEGENVFRDFKKILAAARQETIDQFSEIFKSSQASYAKLADNISKIIPSFDLPDLKSPDNSDLWLASPEVSREQNAWERHKEMLDTLNATVSIQGKLLIEQQSNTKLTKVVLWLSIAGLIGTWIPVFIQLYRLYHQT